MLRFRKLSFGIFFSLALTTVLAWSDEKDDNNFQKDVIECEEALARLAACCPNFDASRVLCNYYYYYNSGCGSSTTERVSPAFSEPESDCIRNTDCETLTKKGVCTRAQLAKPYSSRETSGIANARHSPES